MVEHTVDTYGRLDMAFNNAGVVGFTGDLADESAGSFDHVTAINLRGIWTCMKHELRQMRTQGSGAIVNCRSRPAQSVPLLPHYEGSVGERVPVSSPIIRGSHRRPTRGSVAVHHR